MAGIRSALQLPSAGVLDSTVSDIGSARYLPLTVLPTHPCRPHRSRLWTQTFTTPLARTRPTQRQPGAPTPPPAAPAAPWRPPPHCGRAQAAAASLLRLAGAAPPALVCQPTGGGSRWVRLGKRAQRAQRAQQLRRQPSPASQRRAAAPPPRAQRRAPLLWGTLQCTPPTPSSMRRSPRSGTP